MDDSRWCSPEGFMYTRGQIRWLLKWTHHLRVNGWDWPPRAGAEGLIFITTQGDKGFADGSAVTQARAIRGNLENFLYAKPREGLMVKLFYSLDEGYESIGRFLGIPHQLVKTTINNRIEQIYRQVLKGREYESNKG